MHHQRYYACPARGDGHTCDGIPGDCLRTAVACVMDCQPYTLIHYAQVVNWWDAMRREARERWGTDWACLRLDEPDQPLVQGMAGGWRFGSGRHLVVSSGPSPRGAFHHVCVAAIVADGQADGDPLRLEHEHDPHPLGQGLLSVHELLVPVSPYDPAPTLLELTA